MIKEKLAKLIDVKSIVTLVLTGVFSFLAIIGSIASQDFQDVFMMIVVFYFGVQSQKAATQQTSKKEE